MEKIETKSHGNLNYAAMRVIHVGDKMLHGRKESFREKVKPKVLGNGCLERRWKEEKTVCLWVIWKTKQTYSVSLMSPIFEYLFSSWWFGLWRLWEVHPCQRKYMSWDWISGFMASLHFALFFLFAVEHVISWLPNLAINLHAFPTITDSCSGTIKPK